MYFLVCAKHSKKHNCIKYWTAKILVSIHNGGALRLSTFSSHLILGMQTSWSKLRIVPFRFQSNFMLFLVRSSSSQAWLILFYFDLPLFREAGALLEISYMHINKQHKKWIPEVPSHQNLETHKVSSEFEKDKQQSSKWKDD